MPKKTAKRNYKDSEIFQCRFCDWWAIKWDRRKKKRWSPDHAFNRLRAHVMEKHDMLVKICIECEAMRVGILFVDESCDMCGGRMADFINIDFE